MWSSTVTNFIIPRLYEARHRKSYFRTPTTILFQMGVTGMQCTQCRYKTSLPTRNAGLRLVFNGSLNFTAIFHTVHNDLRLQRRRLRRNPIKSQMSWFINTDAIIIKMCTSSACVYTCILPLGITTLTHLRAIYEYVIHSRENFHFASST